MGVAYLVILTVLLVHPDAFGLFAARGKTVEASLDATVSEFVQHLAAYFLLGTLLDRGFRASRRSVWTIHGLVFGHACATELIQIFVPRRSWEWQDLLADGIGVALAMALCNSLDSRSLWKQSRIAAGLLLPIMALGCTESPPATEEVSQSVTADESAGDVAALQEAEDSAPAALVRSIDWIGNGEWIKVDTHCHTRFSDGKHSIEEVVSKAVEFGCEAIAITDHIDRLNRDDIPRYLEAIDVARRQFPQTLILVGLEWNVPPAGGDEHATVLFPDSVADAQTVIDFCELFDDHGREVHEAARATRGLAWLGEHPGEDGCLPVVVLNHPSRKRDHRDEVYDFFIELARSSPVVAGFSGAPGHQAGRINGAYEYTVETVDRWDPIVLPGETWDRLLQLPRDVWAARAPSDFHRHGGDPWGDYWPGEFSETWVYVPERTTAAVLQALRAGSFFAAHGGIVRNVVLSVDADGLQRAVWPGEAVRVPPGTVLGVQLTAAVPATDLNGEANQIHEVEFIVVGPDTAETFPVSPEPGSNLVATHQVRVESGLLAIRARGRRRVAGGPDLMFYTNPIRVTSANPAAGEQSNMAPASP